MRSVTCSICQAGFIFEGDRSLNLSSSTIRLGSSMKVLSSANLYAVMCPHAVNHPSSRSTPSSPPDDLGLIYSPSVAAENNVPTVSQSESGAQGPHERIALTVVWTPSGPDRARPSSTSRNSLPPGAGPPPPSLCHAHDVHTDGHRAG